MKVEMLMPQMGESIAEATISKWLKNVGDTVERDEVILEISTDKVDSEIPAPSAGVITEILFKEGDVVPVKTKIAVIDSDASATVEASSSPGNNGHPGKDAPRPAEPVEVAPPASDRTPPTPVAQASGAGMTAAANVAPVARTEGTRFYSPLVRSLAEKYNVSLSELDSIAGTGSNQRVTKHDFMGWINTRSATTIETTRAPAPAEPAPVPAQPPTVRDSKTTQVDVPGTDWQADGTKIVPMDNMRRAIAEHMTRSKQTSAHVYSVQEVDMTKVSTWRNKNKAEFKAKEGFNLSFTAFFLEAAVRGLLKFPYINSSVQGNSVVLKRHINLGCAVALENSGLIVPVIKNAEEKNLVGIARALNDLALRARTKKLMPEEVMNGTFTVTNPGVFGTIIGTPIINQPQVAILCLGVIEKRPVVVDDMIAIRERCYLTLSYDHRIIDGAVGGQYLKFICDYLEAWDPNRSLY